MNALAKPRVLCLDDEPQVLESLRDTLRRKFEVVVSTNGFEALRLLTHEPFEVVLADMRMPLLNGARFLSLAREHSPDTMRVMLTGHSALPDAAAAVNEGGVFRLLVKPCKTDDLTAALEAAVEEHHTRLRERAAVEDALRVAIEALVKLAAQVDPNGPSRAERVHRHAVEIAAAAPDVTPTAELERACALMQIGAVGLSHDTRTRAGQLRRLGPEQAAELERLPELAAPLLPAFSQLEPIARVLQAAALPTASQRARDRSARGHANVLRIALDFELQLRQGAPMDAALRALRARHGRYDDEQLQAFAAAMQLT